jgi:hypothetical protein
MLVDTSAMCVLMLLVHWCTCICTGGVRKELFQLLVAQLFDVNFGMFVRIGGATDSSSSDDQSNDDGVLFFNRGCTWSPEEYQVHYRDVNFVIDIKLHCR